MLGCDLRTREGCNQWDHNGTLHCRACAHTSTSAYRVDEREREGVGAWNFTSKGGGFMQRERKVAMQMLENMDQQGVKAHWGVYAQLLQECTKHKLLTEGRQVHDHMLKNQFKPDTFLGNTLISMYAKCGSMADAYEVFQAMEDKDVVSWNAIIAGYAHHRQGQEAIDHFWEMQRQGLKPNRNTFVSILSACVSPTALELGTRIHVRMEKAGYATDVVAGSALISMYCRCGSLADARKVFDKMPEKNVVSWTALISGYAQQGQSKEAFSLFQKLKKQGVKPNVVTFISILGACVSSEHLEQAKQIHSRIKNEGLEQEVNLGNALVSMYARCGSIHDAQEVFDTLLRPDAISWNALIAGYGEAGNLEECFRLFRWMLMKGFEPDKFTYSSLLATCAKHKALKEGKELHARIVKTGGKPDVTIGTALISMYANCGSLADARKVFDEMSERNVVSWNAIIASCIRFGSAKESFEIFLQMQQDGVIPDPVTFITLLNGCNSPETLEMGRYLYSDILQRGTLFNRGFFLNNPVANALLSMYARCGSLYDARDVFYRIRKRDLSSWNAMITAYIQHGRNQEAYELFKKFQGEGGKGDKYTFLGVLRAIGNLGLLEKGRRLHGLVEEIGLREDIHILTTLISMYSKCGSLDEARSVFEKISTRDVVCWNALLAAYAHNDHGSEALTLYREMQREGVKPDKATFSSALNACASFGALEYGKKIHSELEPDVESDIRVSNALIEMYSKCGSLIQAKQVFNRMPKRDANSWNAIIAGYCQVGQGKDALRHYKQMQRAGVKPDNVTFTNVLAAYGLLGEDEEGFDFLESIREWNMEPTEKHYAGMVEILGRAGLLREAEEFIDEVSLDSDTLLWEALLVASAVHNDLELAEKVAEQLLDLDPDTYSTVCEHLSNVYAAAGRWEDVAVLKNTMAETGILKPKSCKLELNNELHTVTANYVPDTKKEEIFDKLEELAAKMRDAGFELGIQSEPHQARDGSLHDHPELVAMAFNLVSTPPGTPVRFVINGRMSNLSHSVAKFISKTYSLEIFVRDDNCFHHFRGSICSCRGYW